MQLNNSNDEVGSLWWDVAVWSAASTVGPRPNSLQPVLLGPGPA